MIFFFTHHSDYLHQQHDTSLTVLVAGLSEGFPLGENDGHSQILKGGDIEEGGVLIVLDVFGVWQVCLIQADRGHRAGNITSATGDERRGRSP